MSTFLQLCVSGLGQGVVIGVFGFVLAFLFQVCKVINVAVGEFAMFGVLASVALTTAGVPLPLALLICVVGAVLLALVYDRAVLVPTIRRPSAERILQLFLLTFALSMVLQGVALRVFGRDVFALDPFLPGEPLRVGGVVLDRQILIVVAVVGLFCLAAWLFTRYTLYGKALTACGINERGALAVGVSPDGYRRLAMSVSAALAVVVGVLVSPVIAFAYNSGFLLAMTGLLAATIAGLRDPVRALVVGLGVGLLQSLVGGYISGHFQSVVALALMTAYVLAKPNVVAAR